MMNRESSTIFGIENPILQRKRIIRAIILENKINKSQQVKLLLILVIIEGKKKEETKGTHLNAMRDQMRPRKLA